LGLVRCPQVCVVPGSISPLLWTIFGPGRLVIPADLLDRLDRDQQATLLAHELAHLRRRDPWVRCLEFVVTGLYWWHPLVWWARHEIREAEEQCCDAWVIRVLPGGMRAYATALIETVDFLSEAQPALPPVASGIGYFHLMRRRLTMIMRGKTPQSLTSAGFLAVLTMGVVLLPLFPTLGRSEQPRERPRDRKNDARRDDRGRADDEMAKARAVVKQLADEMQQLRDRLHKAQERLDQLERSGARGRRPDNVERPDRERGPDRFEKPRRPHEVDPRRGRGDAPRFRPPDGRRDGGPQPPDGGRFRPPDGRRDAGPQRGDDRLGELERKVNLLLREVESLRNEIRGGRGGDRRPMPRDGRIGRPDPRPRERDRNPPAERKPRERNPNEERR
jgi:bla regulator protein BlaR1